MNLPNLEVPGQFYIANVGGARSAGVELELSARPQSGIDLFATLGYTHARFDDGSFTSVDVSGNELPNTPGYTATAGAQLSRALGTRVDATLYGRAEAVFYGAFQYDDANTAGQEAYSLANFRAGVRGTRLFAEAWVRNAFDTRYIPVAFCVRQFRAFGLRGRDGAAPHVRDHRRVDLLTMLHFAYGSNMDPERMHQRCPDAAGPQVAALADFRFAISARGIANILPFDGTQVYGVLWTVSERDLENLDKLEGIADGITRRQSLAVQAASGERVDAVVYLAPDEATGPPKEGYLERVLRGARIARLPEGYITELEEWATKS